MSYMRRYLSLSTVICGLAVAIPEAFGATIVSYPGFSNASGLTFVGNAATATTSDGTVLRLTPADPYQSGAAYSTAALDLGSNATFSTQFQFRFTNAGGVGPADGITFVLTASPTGLGAAGGGLGYQNVSNSVAIEFDTYNNGPTDGNSSNHVAIDTGGNLNVFDLTSAYNIQNCNFDSATPHTASGCMSNGDLWTANISYNGSHISVKLLDPAQGTTFTAIDNYGIDIASQLRTNTAYVGFTGSTGGGWENQDVVNWQFANTATLPTVLPEPPSFWLFGCSLLPLGWIYHCYQSRAKREGIRSRELLSAANRFAGPSQSLAVSEL